jgi:hypothetical protein
MFRSGEFIFLWTSNRPLFPYSMVIESHVGHGRPNVLSQKLRKCAAVVTRNFRDFGLLDGNPYRRSCSINNISCAFEYIISQRNTEPMASSSVQQVAQTQVRLQLSTRDEALLLPQQTGPILVPTCEPHFWFPFMSSKHSYGCSPFEFLTITAKE